MDDNTVRVEGLREVKAALKKLEAGAPKELQKGLKEAANIVARSAASKVPAITGRAASSYKPRASQTSASVAIGGARAPHAGFIDFGGTTGRGHKRGRGKGAIKRAMPKGGRYLYPTIAEKMPEVTRKVEDLIEDLARRTGLNVRQGGEF